MDRASQALAQGVPPGVPKSYRALVNHSSEKAQSQQYFTPWEEDVVVKFLLQMSGLGQLMRMKFVLSIAFSVTCQRPAADRPLKSPSRNWAKALKNRHKVLTAKRVKASD
ncbi:hypothetical protein B0O99DRAFT_665573 [Bisporella sp. PMI_857]|nr:hypothetical protein B0O99DRAFT_665573 [Bisporella sp. PMI_857]